ncbi:MAG: hypothetical protein ACE5EQ_04325 [Phycisphaerae bacterium]
MSEASESIATEESQPAADVDALLSQVEALAEEITTETDAEEPASDTAAPPVTDEIEDSQTDTETASPEATPEPAESASEELNDLLHDPDAPAGESVESDETVSSEMEQKNKSPPVEGKTQNPDPTDASNDSSDPEEGTTDPVDSPARLPIRHRILSVVKRGPKAIFAAKVVPIILVNAGLKILLTIDLPFANWSPGKKRITGFVAIATVVVGLLSWILPDLLNHNPFADMDTHTVISG